MAGQVHGRCPKVGVARWEKLRRVADAQGVLPGLGDRCDNRSAKTVKRNLGEPPRKNRSRADPPIRVADTTKSRAVPRRKVS